MEGDRGLTELLRIAIDYLQWINDDIAIVENFDVDSFLDKGCFDIEDFDREWNETVDELNTILEDDKYLTMLIEYLKVEYHARHNIDPQIKVFRDSLVGLVTKCNSYFPKIVVPGSGKAERNPKEEFLKDKFCENFLADEYADWIGWIDRYFPPEQSKQEQDNEEPVKQDNKPKRISAAAKKLATPELQAVKQKLVDAGLIKDGKWTGSAAEFGCLVLELLEQYKVATNGGRAWTACKNWAGYEDSMKSARNAIDANPNTRGDNAETIRRICKKK